MSCEFLSFERDTIWDVDLPIFQTTGETYYAGLVRYKNPDRSDECQEYSEKHEKFFDPQFIAAQICGLVAVYSGAAAMLVNLIEYLFCSFPCSFLLAQSLFTGAAICQACTMLTYGQPEFW
jgi:hypothetical protein